MPQNDDSTVKMVESSGFPFQLRVVEEIRGNPGPFGWEVLAYEHFWKDEDSGRSGFADIIAGYGMVRLVIECKRGTDATWLFLVPRRAPMEVLRAKCLCPLWLKDHGYHSEWADLTVVPTSPEPEFCIVKGQADKEPMLERTASQLVEATQAIAKEEAELQKASSGDSWIYIPMIVTTASLQVGRFDPMAVDLDRGILSAAATDCQPVPFLRFRKAFSGPHGFTQATRLSEAQKENERTVFVVQANALGGLLERWSVQPLRYTWPHELARARIEAMKSKQ